jgi:hypothetical protein
MNFKHGLSELRKARGDGPIHRQVPFRRLFAPCGERLQDPIIRRSGKIRDVTCSGCLEVIERVRRNAKLRLAVIESNGKARA